jgi:hypothetical protein
VVSRPWNTQRRVADERLFGRLCHDARPVAKKVELHTSRFDTHGTHFPPAVSPLRTRLSPCDAVTIRQPSRSYPSYGYPYYGGGRWVDGHWHGRLWLFLERRRGNRVAGASASTANSTMLIPSRLGTAISERRRRWRPITPRKMLPQRGTEGSNPSSSGGESLQT